MWKWYTGVDPYYLFLGGFIATGSAVWSPCLVACFHMVSPLWVTYQQSSILHAMLRWKCNRTWFLRSGGSARHMDIVHNICNLHSLWWTFPRPWFDHSSLPSSWRPGSLCHTTLCFGPDRNRDAWCLLSPPRRSGVLSSRSGPWLVPTFPPFAAFSWGIPGIPLSRSVLSARSLFSASGQPSSSLTNCWTVHNFPLAG